MKARRVVAMDARELCRPTLARHPLSHRNFLPSGTTGIRGRFFIISPCSNSEGVAVATKAKGLQDVCAGKAAIVTGAAGWIGHATAVAFAHESCDVIDTRARESDARGHPPDDRVARLQSCPCCWCVLIGEMTVGTSL